MRFLLDMNVPRKVGRLLTAAGHECRHVGDVGMSRASDTEIVHEARGRNEVIVTHDLDYGHLLAFSGDAAPSVITFRLRNTRPCRLAARVVDSWPEIERPLVEGAIVILEDVAVRIRSLPMTRCEA